MTGIGGGPFIENSRMIGLDSNFETKSPRGTGDGDTELR
jgi:hypothetical protein